MKTLAVATLLFLFGQTVASPQELIETRTLSGTDLKEVYVSTSGGDIEVESWSGSEVRIDVILSPSSEKAKKEFEERYERRFGVDNGRAWVEIKRKGKSKWNFFNWTNSVGHVVVVKMPRTLNLQLNTSGGDIIVKEINSAVTISTSGGDVKVSDLIGVLKASTSGGDIVLSSITGKIYASTSGGDVKVNTVSGVTEVSTSGGDVNVRNAKGYVDASTSGGDIHVDIRKECDGVKASTSGGDLVINIPAATGVNLDARTTGGRVSLTDDLEVGFKGTKKKDKVDGKINGGGPEVNLRTSGGDIRISGQ